MPVRRMPSVLRGRRAAEGLTQIELARLAGLSRETVSRIEGGDPPSRATARALARALGTRPGLLFEPRVVSCEDERPAGKQGVLTTSTGQGRDATE